MKALNRKEVLVNAKANGTLDSFKPLTRDEAFTKKALGLGGASSWNNLTDKPFGEEKVYGEVLPESSPDLIVPNDVDGVYNCLFKIGPNFLPENGADVIVNISGVEYLCKANVVDNVMCQLGNGSLGGYDFSDTVPFYIELFGDNPVYMLMNNDEAFTISIKSLQETTKTLDPKYLPDIVLRVLFETNDEGQTIVGADKNIIDVIEAARNGVEVIGDILYDAYGISYSTRLRLVETTIMPSYDMLTANFTFVDGGANEDFARIGSLNWTTNRNGEYNQFKYVRRAINYPD